MPYNILFFWDEADGYHFNIKLINPATNKEMDKKYSAMKYYAYRLMIRHLLHLHIIHLGIRYNSFYILDNRRFIDMTLRPVSSGKSCSPSSPTELWEKYKSQMAENILHRIRLERSDMTLDFTTEIYNCTLVMIEDLCLSIANKLLKHLGMPSPNRTASISTCVEWDREQSYNTIDLLSYVTDRDTGTQGI